MWVSTGYSRRILAGMGIGTLAGAGLGAMLGAVTAGPCHELVCFTAERPAEGALIYGAAFGSLGLVIGGIVGFASKRHHWQEVDIALPSVHASMARLHVGLDAAGRPGLVVRLVF